MQSETTLTESEALRRARHGDAAAFECLYHLHLPRVYALCLRMAKNPTQAEDLAQETSASVAYVVKIGSRVISNAWRNN